MADPADYGMDSPDAWLSKGKDSVRIVCPFCLHEGRTRSLGLLVRLRGSQHFHNGLFSFKPTRKASRSPAGPRCKEHEA